MQTVGDNFASMICPQHRSTTSILALLSGSSVRNCLPQHHFKGIMAILFAMHTRDEMKDDADMKPDSRRLSDSSFHFYTNDSFHNQTTFKLKI